MRNLFVAAAALTLVAGAAKTEGRDIVTETLNACSAEINQLCETVSPGNGRLLACFVAHEDKLSPRCLNRLYDAAPELKTLVNTMDFIGRSCSRELDRYCANVEMGEGRISACLRANYEEATPTCKEALKGVGMAN